MKKKDVYTLKLTDHGEEILLGLADKVVSVIGVAGPQRSGKSFLCNTLINKMDGFAIGNSVLPQTKGIWMWGRTLFIDN